MGEGLWAAWRVLGGCRAAIDPIRAFDRPGDVLSIKSYTKDIALQSRCKAAGLAPINWLGAKFVVISNRNNDCIAIVPIAKPSNICVFL